MLDICLFGVTTVPELIKAGYCPFCMMYRGTFSRSMRHRGGAVRGGAGRRRRNMTIPDAYYDCRDSESLQHETPEAAVEEWVALWLTPGCDVSAVIAEHTPITVKAYRRQAVSDAWVRRIAESALEGAAEAFSEEFGDPDGGDDGLDKAAVDEVMPEMIAVLSKFYNHAEVWNCDKIGEQVLDAPAVEATPTTDATA